MKAGVWVVHTDLVKLLLAAGVRCGLPVEWSLAELLERGLVDEGGALLASAFEGREDLPDTIHLPAGVTSIGKRTFHGRTNIITLTIPPGVTTIGKQAFLNCSGITTLTIPLGVRDIGLVAFQGCSGITTLTFPPSISTIKAGAFISCSSLTTLIIPPSVTIIEATAFAMCTSIITLTLSTALTIIQAHTFAGCNSIANLTIPQGVTTIEKLAFGGCSSITTLTIPSGVEAIREHAFAGCDSITTLTIPSEVTVIGEHAFKDCSSITTIISDGTVLMEKGMFLFLIVVQTPEHMALMSRLTTAGIALVDLTVAIHDLDQQIHLLKLMASCNSLAGIYQTVEADISLLCNTNTSYPLLLQDPMLLPLKLKRKWIQYRLLQVVGSKPGATRVQLHGVDRENLLDGLCAQFGIDEETGKVVAGAEHTGELDVQFEDETGFGDGIRREWFHKMVKELTDLRAGLFTSHDGGMTLQPSPVSDQLAHFALLGRIAGFALHHGESIGADWSVAFNKAIFGFEIVLEDLQSVDPDLYEKQVVYIRDSVYADTDGATIEDLCLEFKMAKRSLDPEHYAFLEKATEPSSAAEPSAADTVIFKRMFDGSTAPVTEANKMEYLDLFVQHRLVGEIRLQIDAFRAGLALFFTDDVLREVQLCCTPADLQLLLAGVVDIDVEGWKQSATYTNGLTEESELSVWFWNVVAEFDNDQRAQLLLFCTGSYRAPAGGFNELQGFSGKQHRFELQLVARGPAYLPTSHTCFNQLLLSDYESQNQLREKMVLAMAISEGFAEGI
jgi:E3 ubiquitin-protein ligase HACE1